MMRLKWLNLLVWAALVSVALTGRAREVCPSGYSGFCSKGITDGAVVDFSGLSLDHDARTLTHAFPAFSQPDPLAEKYHPLSPNIFCANNPINHIDPTGESPVFNPQGDFLGNTSEGYTGDVLIYSGTEEIDFSQYSRDDIEANLSDNIGTLDYVRYLGSGLSDEAYSKIYTHIASQFKGLMVYDEQFSMSRVPGGKIGYDRLHKAYWYTTRTWNNPTGEVAIFGTGRYIKDPNKEVKKVNDEEDYFYESTVENIASSIIVHEWYSHWIKHNRSPLKSHRLAYKNVINFKFLWDKTTDRYKAFNLKALLKFTKDETGRNVVDPPYQSLYKKYVK